MIELLLSLLQAAPHPSYGGRLVHELPPPEIERLCAASGPSELLAKTLAFESLVAADGRLVLARDIRDEEAGVTVLLRTDIQTHEGDDLDASFVARALRRAAADCGWLPFLAGRAADAIVPDTLLASVRIELAARPPDLNEWLSRIPVVVQDEGRWLGTGPFKLEGDTLRAFGGHREGRPYLDEVAFASKRVVPRPAPDGAIRVDWYLQVVDGDQSLTEALTELVPTDASLAFLPEFAVSLGSVGPEGPVPTTGSWRLAEEPGLPGSFLDRFQLDLSRRGLMVRRAHASQPRPELVFIPIWSWSDAPLARRRMDALRTVGRLAPEVLARLELSKSPPWSEAFLRSGLVPIASWTARPVEGPPDPSRTPDWVLPP